MFLYIILLCSLALSGCAARGVEQYQLCNDVKLDAKIVERKVFSELDQYWRREVKSVFDINNYRYSGLDCVEGVNVMIFWVKPHAGLGHFFVQLDKDLSILDVSVGK
ncbi:hypothetical protein [Comamonas koreensis]|uniref:Lipoprotein n=1 Tax=Comamonas koreensis TaxID=160825 RepID=A0AAW4XQW2_9BURK|nr:hypothetical protein [Comamonas koreensis]MCD2163839.1 hypothetical protein [Comamonas koreensis]